MSRVSLGFRAMGIVAALFLVILTGSTALFLQSGELNAAGDPVIVAAGDIACDPAVSTFNGGNGTSTSCRQLATYNLIASIAPAAVLPLGDVQYYCGGYDAFVKSYALSWGKVKSITHPAVGNHEYLTSKSSSGYGTGCDSTNKGAAGYFKYFGAAAGTQGKGYYSYNIGAWHLIALNSNCSDAGGCGTGSPQETWLKSDLAAHTKQCILAYWHIPLWSSGGRANSNTYRLTQDLYNAGADVVLTGHDHDYERFAPMDYDGNLDSARGIRAFVVGTGGSDHTSFGTIARNSLVRNNTTFGVLKMTLHATSYDWTFVPESSKTFTDSGNGNCHNATGATPTPTRSATPSGTVTSSRTFTAVADAFVDSSVPDTNYGTSTTLRADASPVVNTYLRFNVQNLSGTVTKATLRVYSTSSSSVSTDVRGVSSTTWGETTITYGNAPPLSAPVATTGALTSGTWISVDVTSLVKGNGLVSMALTTTGSTSRTFASRETGSTAPQLIVQTAAAPSGTITPAPAPSLTATPGSVETSVPSPTPVGPTATPASSQMTLMPAADAYVYEADPTTNYGSSSTLRVGSSPVQRSYLRFVVQGLPDGVSYASLRLYANSTLAAGFTVNAVSDNTWTEGEVLYSNAPPVGEVIGSSGPVTAGSWVTIDVSNYVTGNGTFNVALVPAGATALSIASRESGANSPQLLVETGQ